MPSEYCLFSIKCVPKSRSVNEFAFICTKSMVLLKNVRWILFFYSSLVCADLRQRQTRQHHCRRRPSMLCKMPLNQKTFRFYLFNEFLSRNNTFSQHKLRSLRLANDEHCCRAHTTPHCDRIAGGKFLLFVIRWTNSINRFAISQTFKCGASFSFVVERNEKCVCITSLLLLIYLKIE